MIQKYYLHCSDIRFKNATFVISSHERLFISDLSAMFLKEFSSMVKIQIERSDFVVCGNNGEILNDSDYVDVHFENKSDVYMMLNHATFAKLWGKKSNPNSSLKNNSTILPNLNHSLHPQLLQAFNNKYFSQAINLANTLLQVKQNEIEALLHIACVRFYNKQYDKSLESFQHLLKLRTNNAVDNDSYSLAHLGVAKCLWYLHFDQSTRLFSCVVPAYSNNFMKLSFDETSPMDSNKSKIISNLESAMNLANKDWKDYIQMFLARVYIRTDDSSLKQKGLVLLESLMVNNENNTSVMFEYAYVFSLKELIKEALMYLMKLLVLEFGKNKNGVVEEESLSLSLNPWNIISFDDVTSKAQVQLANCLAFDGDPDGKEGLIHLNKAMCDAASVASAVSFIAQSVKHCGASRLAVEIFAKAAKLSDYNFSFVLSLVHMQEICSLYSDALEISKIAFSKYKEYGIKNVSSGHSLLSKSVLDILTIVIKGVSDSYSCIRNNVFCDSIDAIPVLFDAGLCQVKHPGPLNKCLEPIDASQFSTAELDYFALILTVVKMLYVIGVFSPIPPLITLIENFRSKMTFSQTTIRNEHAYYLCISQLMRPLYEHFSELSKEITPLPEDEPIYVCGDSHCLSPGWRHITVNNRRRLLIPKLVTGTKCFHLRPESNFFPKSNFYSVVNTIPNNADVIFIFGEIDCREGLVLSVEKAIYGSLDESIEVAIDIYFGALKSVVNRKSFRSFIHPIVPVLDFTRVLNNQFSAKLRSRLAKNSAYKYLDFHEKLLNSDGSFNMKYNLDGTHMHPDYLVLLEEALNPYF